MASFRPAAELEPETVLPCQLADPLFGAARVQPEKRLQLAVLQEAVLTFHHAAGIAAAGSRRVFSEVEGWFSSDDARGPFAFVTICHSLNFDPGYIRAGLRRWEAGIGHGRRRPRLRRDVNGARHHVVALRRSA